jgi:hypothetical protein
MKKLLITALLVTGFWGTAIAQQDYRMWLTGILHFSGTDHNSQSETTFIFMPEFGYHLEGPWAIGTRIGFANEWTTNVNNNTRREGRTAIIPFVRYFFGVPGTFNFFAQAELPMNFYGGENFDGTSLPSSSSVGLNLRPGLFYSISGRWGLTMHMPSFFSVLNHGDLSQFELSINEGYTIQRYLLNTALGITYSF